MKIHIKSEDISATVEVTADKVELQPYELLKLFKQTLGYSLNVTCVESCRDYSIYKKIETLADESDKSLIESVETRLNKSKEKLKPTTRSWTEKYC